MRHRGLQSVQPLTLALLLLWGCTGGSGSDSTPERGDGTAVGLEVLLQDPPDLILGKRVGLITNHTGIDGRGRRNVDLLAAREDFDLTTLFAFEHGLSGRAAPGVAIESGTERETGLPVYSLYGRVRKPTPKMLENIDVLLYDVQGVGSRTYTRLSTMALSMEAAGEQGISFVVLDRPNPLGGVAVEGGRLDTAFASFVGMYPIPLRHGMTVGELAQLYNRAFGVDVDLTVVEMDAWRRGLWFDETGLPWVNTSPNIRSLDAALLYPGTVLLEGTNLSEGRGTDRPFEQTGAPWLDADGVVARMNEMDLPGVRFERVRLAVSDDAFKYPGETLPGIRLVVTDRDAFRPVTSAVRLIDAVYRRHPEEFEWRSTIDRLAGTDRLRLAVEDGTVDELLSDWARDADRFDEMRVPYLLYR